MVPARGTRHLRLEATDLDWAAGRGDLVRGPALSVLLALAGRPSACDELEGDGVTSLRRRSRGGHPGSDGLRPD